VELTRTRNAASASAGPRVGIRKAANAPSKPKSKPSPYGNSDVWATGGIRGSGPPRAAKAGGDGSNAAAAAALSVESLRDMNKV